MCWPILMYGCQHQALKENKAGQKERKNKVFHASLWAWCSLSQKNQVRMDKNHRNGEIIALFRICTWPKTAMPNDTWLVRMTRHGLSIPGWQHLSIQLQFCNTFGDYLFLVSIWPLVYSPFWMWSFLKLLMAPSCSKSRSQLFKFKWKTLQEFLSKMTENIFLCSYVSFVFHQ